MFQSKNPFLRKYPPLDEDEYLRVDFRDTKLLSLALSLISAISFIGTYVVFKYTNTLFDLIYLFSCTILLIGSFIISSKLKIKVLFIIYKIAEGAFLSSLSILLKIKFYDWFETYNGYMFVSAAAMIVISNIVVNLYYFFFGLGIRNFIISMVSCSLFILIVSSLTLMYLSNTVYGFSLLNNLLSVIPIMIFFVFISIVYNEEVLRIINNGCKKYYTWSLSFGITAVFLYSFIEFINLFRYNSRK